MKISKLDAEAVRKIVKLGEYSYTIGVPKMFIDSLGWKKGQKVVVKLSGKKVVIEDWKG